MIPEISIGEFLLFTVIALIIINPDDWPKVLRKVGYYYGQFHDFIMETRQFTRKTYEDIVFQSEPIMDAVPEGTEDGLNGHADIAWDNDLIGDGDLGNEERETDSGDDDRIKPAKRDSEQDVTSEVK